MRESAVITEFYMSSSGTNNHDKFANPARDGVLIIVPRHRTVSPGVARDIAKKAGWI
jgi:hypothetical protein